MMFLKVAFISTMCINTYNKKICIISYKKTNIYLIKIMQKYFQDSFYSQ